MTGLRGVTFWEKFQFLGEKNWKILNFGAAGAKISIFFDFLIKIMIFRHTMSEIALKTLEMQ